MGIYFPVYFNACSYSRSTDNIVFTMASNVALKDIAAADFNEVVEIDGVIKRLIPYLAAGIAAPL